MCCSKHVQHHRAEKDQLWATWTRDELAHREEDFRAFEAVLYARKGCERELRVQRILNLGVEQKKDATLVDQ